LTRARDARGDVDDVTDARGVVITVLPLVNGILVRDARANDVDRGASPPPNVIWLLRRRDFRGTRSRARERRRANAFGVNVEKNEC